MNAKLSRDTHQCLSDLQPRKRQYFSVLGCRLLNRRSVSISTLQDDYLMNWLMTDSLD